MILKKVLLVPVKHQAKLEKGMITNRGCILDVRGDMIYASNRVDGNESGGCQEWWLSEISPVKFYLVDTAGIKESNMNKGDEYYDGKGNIRVWGTGHIFDIHSKRIIATPDQLGIISRIGSDGIDSGDAPNRERTVTYDINNETIQEILDDGECEVEMENKHKNHASGLEPTGHPLMDHSILENYEPKLVNGKVTIHI